MANAHDDQPERTNETSDAFSDLNAAVTELKSAVADTDAWRALVGLAERHPLVSLYAFPALMLGLSAFSTASDRPVDGAFYAVVAIVSPWFFRR